MLSNVIEATENNSDIQTNEALSAVATYFEELADFLNESNVIINMTVNCKNIQFMRKLSVLIYYHSDHHGCCSCGEFLPSVGTREHHGC